MVYVKADIDDETHKEIRVEAAERGVRIEQIAKERIEHRLANAEPATQDDE